MRTSTHPDLHWPGDRRFAFSIVDDTDNSTLASVKPVYDYLHERGLRTTKTVWVYPPRDHYTGDCLLDEPYRDFVLDLQAKGFEIALHNVGSGSFSRQEILEGLETYQRILGAYPRMQINHANNPDNIYWGFKRYAVPLRWMMRASSAHRVASGEAPDSPRYWGDAAKRHIDYVRNHTFNGIDTARYDRMMPYRERRKAAASNYWFSSSDAHTVKQFNELLRPEALDRLEAAGGLCIAYTHLNSGFSDDSGALQATFRGRIDDIARRNGWFVPASTILDHLRENCGRGGEARYVQLLRLDGMWLIDRIGKEIRHRLSRRS